MIKIILRALVLIGGIVLVSACQAASPTAAPAPIPTAAVTLPAPTTTALLPTPTLQPAITPTALQPVDTLAPVDWQNLPVIPTANETVKTIYANGQALGNDPHAFSIIGDCLSLIENLFGDYGKTTSHYDLAEYASLQAAIDWFKPSFQRQSLTVGNGYNTAAQLSTLFADPDQCQPNETPLTCEFRLHQPSFVIISLGTDDFETPPDVFESRMRRLIEFSIQQGAVPILATKADNREGGHAFNQIIANLAREYDLPLWNFWLAVQPLPDHGLLEDGYHLTWGSNHLDYPYTLTFAFPMRNLTALQALDSIWRGVTETP